MQLTVYYSPELMGVAGVILVIYIIKSLWEFIP
jgi:hypothetical protein